MALQNLDQQLLDKVGEAVSGDIGLTQDIIDDFYTQSVRAIVNRISALNPLKLWAFASNSDITDSTGMALAQTNSSHILNVLRNDTNRDYPCSEINAFLSGRAQDPNDIEYATRFEPRFYRLNGSIYVLPTPTATEKGKVSHVKFPSTIDASAVDSIGDTSGITFPVELDHVAVLYALIQTRLLEEGLMRRKAQDEIEAIRGSSSVGTSSWTSGTTKTITHNLGYYPIVKVMDSSGNEVDVEVVYDSTNAFTLTIGYAQFTGGSPGTVFYGHGYLAMVIDALPSWSVQAKPTLPALTLFEMTSLPTYSVPVMTSLPTFTISADITTPGSLTMPSAPTLPTFISAVPPSLPASLSEANLDFTGITTPSYSAPSSPSDVVLPTFPTLPTALAESNIDFSSLSLPVYNPPTAPSIATLALTQSTVISPGTLVLPVPPAFTNLDLTGVSLPTPAGHALSYIDAGSVPTYAGPAQFTFDESSHITDALNIAKGFIDDATLVNNLTDDIATQIQADDTETAKVSIQAAANEISRAGTAVQNEIAQMKDVADKVREALGQFNGEINAFQADVQNNAQDLNEQIQQYVNDIKIYQAEVDTIVKEWLAEEVQFKLEKYGKEATASISEFSANVQYQIQKFSNESSSEINVFQSQANADISKYSQDVQEANQKYNSDIQIYANDIRKLIDQYEKERGTDIQIYRTNFEKLISGYQQEVQAVVQKYGTNVQKYSAEVSEAISSYQAEIQEYSADVGKLIDQYKSESDSDIQKYRANFEKLITDFTAQANANASEYQVRSTALINKYGAEIQDNIQEFQSNVDYRIKEAQHNLQRDIQKYDVQVKAFIAEYSADVTAKLGEYNGKVGAYVSEYQTKNTALISKHSSVSTARIQKYSEVVNAEAQKFNANISKATVLLNATTLLIQTSADYNTRCQLALAEVESLSQKFENEIMAYAGVVQQVKN